MATGEVLSVLELFSGIGGMHAAIQECEIPYKIVGSYEINPLALSVYEHNFKGLKRKERNIIGMNTKTLENLQPDLLVMSPPCQPFTRQGLKKDVEDSRCSPFLHILSLLRESDVIPKFILMENVAGFESSAACAELIDVLNQRGYVYQQFLLTPSELGIPNSRLRYYMVAKIHSDSSFCFVKSKEIHRLFPVCICYHSNAESMPEERSVCSVCSKVRHNGVSSLIHRRFSKWHVTNLHSAVHPLQTLNLTLSSFLDNIEDPESYLVQKKNLLKYAKVFDIVSASSTGSCCFTRGYGHYNQGTGSVIQHNMDVSLHDVFKTIAEMDESHPTSEELLPSLKLRYFTPTEVLRLLCFPDSYSLPSDLSQKQAYRVLGNSVNVLVVSILLILILN